MNLVKTVCVRAAILCVLFVSAQSFTNDKKVQELSPVSVKFIGDNELLPVVQVDVDNVTGEELYFTLKDENGSIVYNEKISDKKYSKKFQFSDSEAGKLNFSVVLTGKNSRKSDIFRISNVTNVVENIVVTKLR